MSELRADSPDPAGSPALADEQLRDAAPAYADLEAKRARAGVAAALFGGDDDDEEAERLTVGRYRIDSRLGSGGMGVVYRGHDPELDRPVAVKLLHNESSTDDKARARMLREARSLAKLSHPNVITVYDVGTDDEQVFVAMELVAGQDLRRWLDGNRQASWQRVLELFIAAGRGLEAAHEVALVHRDFKPENVLVGDDGRVRVLDFGLARVNAVGQEQTGEGQLIASASVLATDGEGVDPTDVARLPTAAFAGGLTETGALIGTPLYMAPELYAGKPADVRSDQFAFCASLYEGLYRQLPFGSRNLVAHVEAVRAGKVVEPPHHTGGETRVPAPLWPVIARGLSVGPDDRWPSMAALLRELERLASEPAPTELPEPIGGGKRWAIAVGVVAAVLGLVGFELGWFGQRDRGGEVAAADVQPSDVPPNEAPPSKAPPSKAPDPAPTNANPDADSGASNETSGSETGSSEPPPSEPPPSEPPPTEPATEPTGPKLDGWCHLHEDRYTLLARTPRRRASVVHQGTCYTCRVEQRRNRTQNFQPRDCAGYSLCGEESADKCE